MFYLFAFVLVQFQSRSSQTQSFLFCILVIIPIAQLQAAVEESRDDTCNRLLIRPEEKQPVAAPVGVQNETVQETVQMKDFQERVCEYYFFP